MAKFWLDLECLVTILCILFQCIAIHGEMINMKIVDEPSSYGLSNNFGGMYQSQEDKLTMRVKPANFSGPPHLKRLIGKCFNLVDDNYKYDFCPFSNVTQHEQSLRWNPYSGVLGVYQEWEIVNNTFVAMVMPEGDACGDIFRSVKVFFKCGNHSQITSVSEPHTCQYHMDFLTPLVCNNISMLVYPNLSPLLKGEWNVLETRLMMEEVTEQGYQKKLHKIFEKAGYYLSSETRKMLAKPEPPKAEEHASVEEKGEFDSMHQCTEEVKRLRAEVKQLKEALLVRGLKEFQVGVDGPKPPNAEDAIEKHDIENINKVVGKESETENINKVVGKESETEHVKSEMKQDKPYKVETLEEAIEQD